MPKRAKPKPGESAAEKARREWAAEFRTCAVCGGTYLLQTHEIASKGQTSNGDWRHPAAYLLVCQKCHNDHFAWLPEVVQCAVKAIVDPERSDPAVICQLRHRAPTAITVGEVKAWQQFLLDWNKREHG